MRIISLIAVLILNRCTGIRDNAIFAVDWTDQAPRTLMEITCNGQKKLVQGLATCEEKGAPSASVIIKVPPAEGRLIWSDGETKISEDFNWYPESGFWIWKKKTINDTWIPLDLVSRLKLWGDKPIALEVAGVYPDIGVVSVRGFIFHRTCNDVNVQCSTLEIRQDCDGRREAAGPGELLACSKMVGSSHKFQIQTKGSAYQAKPGAKLYVASVRGGVAKAIDVTEQAIKDGLYEFVTPSIPKGPVLYAFRLSWMENGVLVQKESVAMLHGTAQDWTPMDHPHSIKKDSRKVLVDFVKPVLSDMLEVVSYRGGVVTQRNSGTAKISLDLRSTDITCAYAWSRSSMDLTQQCVDGSGEELQDMHYMSAKIEGE